MLNIGHMGLTAGLSSAVSAYWVRKRVRKLINSSSTTNSLCNRIRRRSKYAIAGLAFTGCATVVSGSIDSIEKQLGFEHRTAGHSIPILGGLWSTAKLAKRAGDKAVEWVSDRIGYSHKIKPIVQELKELASWVLDGSVIGYFTHLLGDLPTKGSGGFSSLKLLYPITKRRFNLRIVKAGNKLFNKIFTIIGAFVSASSWAIIGSHLVSPELPEASLWNVFSSIKSLTWKAITGGLYSLYEETKNNLAQVENALCDAWATTGSGLKSWAHRTRVRLQHILGSPEDNWYPDKNPSI